MCDQAFLDIVPLLVFSLLGVGGVAFTLGFVLGSHVTKPEGK